MKLDTHMPRGERRKLIDIEDRRTLTFDLQTSISIGFILSPSGMCLPRFI
jgi:hypothetical protein